MLGPSPSSVAISGDDWSTWPLKKTCHLHLMVKFPPPGMGTVVAELGQSVRGWSCVASARVADAAKTPTTANTHART